MASWNDIFNAVQPLNAIEEKKKQYFNSLCRLTKRNCVVYFSAWQQKQGVSGSFAIDDNDRNGFMNALFGLDKAKGLDLIIHTPGGDLAATQSIVNYLFTFFNGDIRVIVPHTAMSAGTMIACAAKEIIMGKHSNLGPIDPQIGNMPANEYIKLLNEAKKEINSNQNLEYWKMVLDKYPPTFFGMCQNAIASSKKIVTGWLQRSMLIGTPQNIIDQTVSYLSDYNYHLQHNTRLSMDELSRKTVLKITPLENDPKLQDYILSLYHCYQILVGMSNCSKIIENQNSVKYVVNHR